MWYYTVVGQSRCPVVDTWWQTETGCHMIAPAPGAISTKPGSCTLPLPGIDAAVVDETGHPVEQGKGGFLVIKRPFPSMLRTLWNDPERFRKLTFQQILPVVVIILPAIQLIGIRMVISGSWDELMTF